MARRSPKGKPVKELYICITLSLVLAASFVTDTIGIHALFGAFVVGIIVPKDGSFVGLFLPLYFASSGLKINGATIEGAQSWELLVFVIFNACFGKIIGTVGISMLFKVPFMEADIWIPDEHKRPSGTRRPQYSQGPQVLMALFTTFITTPIVMSIYKLGRKEEPYKHRRIQQKDLDTEL
ncbi:hypothetical protein CRYUN_Cryun08bG0098700 [Craigia yunnanensis]